MHRHYATDCAASLVKKKGTIKIFGWVVPVRTWLRFCPSERSASFVSIGLENGTIIFSSTI
jgi:hypothetical protein